MDTDFSEMIDTPAATGFSVSGISTFYSAVSQFGGSRGGSASTVTDDSI
jgi:hypothetical protein